MSPAAAFGYLVVWMVVAAIGIGVVLMGIGVKVVGIGIAALTIAATSTPNTGTTDG